MFDFSIHKAKDKYSFSKFKVYTRTALLCVRERKSNILSEAAVQSAAARGCKSVRHGVQHTLENWNNFSIRSITDKLILTEPDK